MSKVVRFMVDGYDGRPIDIYLSVETINELFADIENLQMLQNGMMRVNFYKKYNFLGGRPKGRPK